MNVILSIFSNSEKYLDTYINQIKNLKEKPFLILLEGDSQDNTYETLKEFIKDYNGYLLKDDRGKIFPSVVNPKKFIQVSELFNKIFDLIPDKASKVAFIESDLEWNPEDLDFLFDLVEDYSFICPYVIYKPENIFYDIWAYRRSEDDYFKHDLTTLSYEIEELYSAGSFLVMNADIARNNRLSADEAIVGFCKSVKESLFCIPLHVWHP